MVIFRVCLFFRPMLRLAMDCPVLEDTLMRVLVIGLSPELPLGPAEAIDLADVLVRRAANQQAEGKHKTLFMKYLCWEQTGPKCRKFLHAKLSFALGLSC